MGKETPGIFLMAGGASLWVNAATPEVTRGHVWAGVALC